MNGNRICLTLGLLAIVPVILGCDREEVKKKVKRAADQAKNTIDRTAETVKQEINLVGSMELSTNPPLASKACYVSLIPIGGDRPNVLQLSSQKDPETSQRFPSIFVHATTQATSLDQLSGQTLQAEVIAQESREGPLWYTPTLSPASLKVVNVTENAITCEIVTTRIINALNDEEKSVGGKFLGLLN